MRYLILYLIGLLNLAIGYWAYRVWQRTQQPRPPADSVAEGELREGTPAD